MADAISPPQAGARTQTTLDLTSRRQLWNRVTYVAFAACACALVICIAAIIIFISSKGLTTFFKDKVSLTQFFFSPVWQPDEKPAAYGAGHSSSVHWK